MEDNLLRHRKRKIEEQKKPEKRHTPLDPIDLTESEREYPCGLPAELWELIAHKLGSRDLGRFARVCFGLNTLVTNSRKNILISWFNDLKKQCQASEDALTIIDYCEQNVNNKTALITLVDKLMRTPANLPEVDVEDNISGSVDRLVRHAYADPHNNPRDTLTRVLMSIIENGEIVIARADVLVNRDKKFNNRLNNFLYTGGGLLLLGIGILIFLHRLTQGNISKIVIPACIIPGPLVTMPYFLGDTDMVQRYKNSSFWKMVDALPPQELNRLPVLRERIAEEHAQWNLLTKLCRLSTKFTVGITLLIFFSVLIASRFIRSDINAGHRSGSSGP